MGRIDRSPFLQVSPGYHLDKKRSFECRRVVARVGQAERMERGKVKMNDRALRGDASLSSGVKNA